MPYKDSKKLGKSQRKRSGDQVTDDKNKFQSGEVLRGVENNPAGDYSIKTVHGRTNASRRRFRRRP
jgi:hypothetical protein